VLVSAGQARRRADPARRARDQGDRQRRSTVSSGRGGELAADYLFLHEGVIPNVQISLALQLRHEWTTSSAGGLRRSLGAESLPTSPSRRWRRIAGAEAAVLTGRLAASMRAVARSYGEAERDRRARRSGQHSTASGRCRPFLDRLFSSVGARSWSRPEDEMIACRCEEVVGRSNPPVAARLGLLARTNSRPSPAAGWGLVRADLRLRWSPLSSPRRARQADCRDRTYRPRAPFQTDQPRRLPSRDRRTRPEQGARAMTGPSEFPAEQGNYGRKLHLSRRSTDIRKRPLYSKA